MTLEFAINKQIIFRIDNEIPVADSVNYLKAHFDFSDDWNGEITVIFKAEDKKFSPKEQILNNGECFVPWEVLTGTYFTVSAFCGNLHTANEIRVDLIRSGYIKGETPQPPTPDVYTQIIERLDNLSVGGVSDYTKLKNIPRKLVSNVTVNFDEKGIYEFMVPVTLTFHGDDTDGNRTEYQIQAEKGAILLSSGNFGNEHNKILITAHDVYCEQYRDMEYRFDTLSNIVYMLGDIGSALSILFEQQSELAEMVNNALSEVKDTVSALNEAFTQEQSKTEQKFTDVNNSMQTLSDTVNQEYLSKVDIEDVRIYTDENGNNKFTFDNNTLEVTATGGNSYVSDYIPITEKLQITGYSAEKNQLANGIAFVTYDSNKQPIQAYRGETHVGTMLYVYEKTAVVTPEEAAFVRIRSRDNYDKTSKATVERFIGTKEKIEEMQAQLDSLLGLTTAAYTAEE